MDNIDENALQSAQQTVGDLDVLTSHVASSSKIKLAFGNVIDCMSAIIESRQDAEQDDINDKISYLEDKLDEKLCVAVDLTSSINKGSKVAMTHNASLFIDDYVHLSGDSQVGYMWLSGSLSAVNVNVGRSFGSANGGLAANFEDQKRFLTIDRDASQICIKDQTLEEVIDNAIKLDESTYIEKSLSSTIVKEAVSKIVNAVIELTSDSAYCIDALSSTANEKVKKNALMRIYGNGTKVDCSILVAAKGSMTRDLDNLPAKTCTFTASEQCILYISMTGARGWGYTKSLKVKTSNGAYLYVADGNPVLEGKHCYMYVPANETLTIEATWHQVDTEHFDVQLDMKKVTF